MGEKHSYEKLDQRLRREAPAVRGLVLHEGRAEEPRLGKVIGGDHVGGRLKSEFEKDKASLHKVKRATSAVGKLSRGVPDSRGHEVRGEDRVGKVFWFREWFYKSDVTRSVINVSLRREGLVLDVDPEIEAMLDPIDEVGEPKEACARQGRASTCSHWRRMPTSRPTCGT